MRIEDEWGELEELDDELVKDIQESWNMMSHEDMWSAIPHLNEPELMEHLNELVDLAATGQMAGWPGSSLSSYTRWRLGLAEPTRTIKLDTFKPDDNRKPFESGMVIRRKLPALESPERNDSV